MQVESGISHIMLTETATYLCMIMPVHIHKMWTNATLPQLMTASKFASTLMVHTYVDAKMDMRCLKEVLLTA